MFANWLDPVVKDYLMEGSLLRSQSKKILLGIIVAVLVVFAFAGWSGISSGKSVFLIYQWIPLSLLGSVIGYVILAFLDRERRVRYFHFFTILTVGLVTAPVAAYINIADGANKVIVGFNEEFFKILPVLLLAIYIPNLIRTKKDGLVYGALAGLGFNIVEIGAYIQQTAAGGTSVIDAILTHLTRLSLFGLGGHIIWSAFIGLGIGYAMESTKTGWAKWKTAVIFYLLAAATHSLFDLGLSMVGIIVVDFFASIASGVPFKLENINMEAAAQPGPMNSALRYGTYIVNLPFIIVMIQEIGKSFGMENQAQVEELSTENSEVIQKNEFDSLKDERLFTKRKYTNYPLKISSKLVLYQNLLAIRKHAAKQTGQNLQEIESITVLRQAIKKQRLEVAEGLGPVYQNQSTNPH